MSDVTQKQHARIFTANHALVAHLLLTISYHKYGKIYYANQQEVILLSQLKIEYSVQIVWAYSLCICQVDRWRTTPTACPVNLGQTETGTSFTEMD